MVGRVGGDPTEKAADVGDAVDGDYTICTLPGQLVIARAGVVLNGVDATGFSRGSLKMFVSGLRGESCGAPGGSSRDKRR